MNSNIATSTTWLKRLFQPLEIENDQSHPGIEQLEIKTNPERRAAFLRILAFVWLGQTIITFIFVRILVPASLFVLTPFVVIIAVNCFILFLNQRGYIRLASYIFCLGLTLSNFVGLLYAINASGPDVIKSTAITSIMGISILFAGSLISKRAAFAFAFLNSVGFSMVIYFYVLGPVTGGVGAMIEGLLANLAKHFAIIMFWWLLAFISLLYESTLNKAFGRLRAALQNLKRYSQELEKKNLLLEQEIVERNNIEFALQQAKEAAEAANKAKSAFLANMSHELRTPLNAILGFTQLMSRNRSFPAEQLENLQIISRSGEHLLSLINDVLEMSKIEAGRVTLNEQDFDLIALLTTLEEMFRLRAGDKGLQLIFERAPNLPQYVCTDESKLRQILINLLSNAIKFTEEGGISVRVAYQTTLQKPRRASNGMVKHRPRLLFEVEDSGVGIAASEMDKLFMLFVQTESGEHRPDGTGLGLPISREFVRLMGGDLTVRSRVGAGSLFMFDIQVELADSAQVEPVRPTRRVIGLEANQPTYRILVVEDRWENRELLLKLLKPIGFEVQSAVNGQEAIELWADWQPHLIWMDMRMPVMDGYQATQHIKKSTKGQATVIIALTASAFEEQRAVVLSAGCDDFVRKPFREAELFDKMAEHLNVRYLYDDEDVLITEPLHASQLLTSSTLATLPTDLLTKLEQATIRANFTLIFDLIEQIGTHNAGVADALSNLADEFEYDKILSLLRAG